MIRIARSLLDARYVRNILTFLSSTGISESSCTWRMTAKQLRIVSYLDQPDDLSRSSRPSNNSFDTRAPRIINGNRWLASNRHENKRLFYFFARTSFSSSKNETRVLRKRSCNSRPIISSLSRSLPYKFPPRTPPLSNGNTNEIYSYSQTPNIYDRAAYPSIFLPLLLPASLFYFIHLQSYEIRIVIR